MRPSVLHVCATCCILLALGACERADVDSVSDRPGISAQPAASGASIADIAERVMPSVVSVWSDGDGGEAGRNGLMRTHPFQESSGERVNVGSGVVLSSDGVIVTNDHVVSGARNIRVATHDGRTYEAKLVGEDPATDIAVLRIPAKGLPPLPVATSVPRIGDVVLAVGNPFGVGQTVTMGIVSGLGRANLGITAYGDFIQTDAAINPGNSGGALVDIDGRLVGLNTAILSRTGGYDGVAFAIPADSVVRIATELLERGKVLRGWLGATFDEPGPLLVVGDEAGVRIAEIAPGGPAAGAGLRAGDLVTRIDGKRVAAAGEIRNAIGQAKPGTRVVLEVQRDGRSRSIGVDLGDEPPPLPSPPDADTTSLVAGLTVIDLDPQLRAHLRIPPGLDGVVVVHVEPDSPLGSVGIQPGDLILELGGTATTSPEALEQAARITGDHILLFFYRDGMIALMALQR